jgi:hypothetical protein
MDKSFEIGSLKHYVNLAKGLGIDEFVITDNRIRAKNKCTSLILLDQNREPSFSNINIAVTNLPQLLPKITAVEDRPSAIGVCKKHASREMIFAIELKGKGVKVEHRLPDVDVIKAPFKITFTKGLEVRFSPADIALIVKSMKAIKPHKEEAVANLTYSDRGLELIVLSPSKEKMTVSFENECLINPCSDSYFQHHYRADDLLKVFKFEQDNQHLTFCSESGIIRTHVAGLNVYILTYKENLYRH